MKTSCNNKMRTSSIEDAGDDGVWMGWRTKRNKIELNTKQVRGEYEDASRCLIFIAWNYYEELTVIRTDSQFYINS